jgi:hypothetical protein
MTTPCTVPFVQYLRPDGRQTLVSIERSEPIAALASRIREAGYQFECESLTTGQASFTVTHPTRGDLAIEIVQNGPEVPAAVDRLVEGFARRIGIISPRTTTATGENANG